MAIDNDAQELGRLRDPSLLWRISAWGGAASVALAAAVLVAQTDVGTKQTRQVFAPEAATSKTITEAELSPRAANQDTLTLQLETQRLQAQVRELTADRDRLIARIATVERNLTEMTGAIRRQILPTATPRTPPPMVSAPRTMPPAAAPLDADTAADDADSDTGPQARRESPADETALPKVESRIEPKAEPKLEPKADPKPEFKLDTMAAAKPEAMPQAMPQAKPAPNPRAAETPAQSPASQSPLTTASVPMPPARASASDPHDPSQPSKPELGIELGGARSMDILQARWLAVKANFGPMLVGMYPLFVHDRRHAIPFRLLVGPVPNGASAAQMCKRFAASKVSCRATRFIGEQLVLQ